ncbi:hypothetical protein [Bartonella sp. HY406]|uniref:hypothetical protein n=1 Tax=Bartonella sp. HY406 TaxID=2979331 RepID=UPI0021C76D58|nr:hypothetical protein [Bartonella sp. HY406]UXN05073.1 hypothetical protein N6B01_14740 [Bartonella sp. HY406]
MVSTNEDSVEQVTKELQTLSVKAKVVICDVVDKESARTLFDVAEKEFGASMFQFTIPVSLPLLK